MTNTDRDTVLQYSLNSEVKIRERYSAQKTYTCHLFYAVVYSLKHGFFAYSHGYSHSLCDVWMYKYEGSGWDTRLVWWNVVCAFHNRAETSKGVRKRIRYHAVCQPRPQGLFPSGLNWGGWEYQSGNIKDFFYRRKRFSEPFALSGMALSVGKLNKFVTLDENFCNVMECCLCVP